MRQRASSLLVFQELEVGYIPVNVTIFEGVEGQSNVAISDKLLNNIRYNGNGIGIGMFTKTFVENDGDYYFVDPNKSEPFKADSGGIRSLAGKMSKFFKEKLQPLAITRRNLIGIYDEYYREYKLSAESDSGVVIEVSLEDGDWTGDNHSVLPAQITTNNGAHNTISYNSTTGVATYTPTTGYTGSDSFSFQFGSVTRNVCMNVIGGDSTPAMFFFNDVVDQPTSTLITSNYVLISDITIPSNISVTGGEYQINDGAWTSTNGFVNNNDTVRVRQTSSSISLETTNCTLSVGSYADTFSVRTSIAPNTNEILVLDIFNSGSSDNFLGILTVPVFEANNKAYTGNNFVLGSDLASEAFILASDYVTDTTYKLRFLFNIRSMMSRFTGEDDFVFKIKGRKLSAGSINGAWGTYTDNPSANMAGSPGSYKPFRLDGTELSGETPFTKSVAGGANGTYDETLPDVLTFTYNRITNVLTAS